MSHEFAEADRQFIRKFESFEIAPEEFDHYSHIRMAYVYLCEHDAETTCGKVRDVLCRFLTHVGIEPSTKYHETMTQAWVVAVRHFMDCTPNQNSASEFIEANPILVDTDILLMHYSKQVLYSDAARSSFIEPDLAAIPRKEREMC